MPAQRNTTRPHSRAHRGAVGAVRPLIELPAAGCSLPIPRPPTGVDWTRAQRARWRELWRSPQAVMWDESVVGVVAVVVTFERAIFDGRASAWQATELRHAADSLGLSPRAMAALGWAISE